MSKCQNDYTLRSYCAPCALVSDLIHFVQNLKMIRFFFSQMANVDLRVTLNDLQGQMRKKLTQGGLSLVDLTNFVKNGKMIWLSFENGLWGTWRTFRVPDRRTEGWGHLWHYISSWLLIMKRSWRFDQDQTWLRPWKVIPRLGVVFVKTKDL